MKSLLGEEMGLGNWKGHCGVLCLSIRDGCWMVTRVLEGRHSWRGTGVGGTMLLLCSRVPVCGVAVRDRVWGDQRGLDVGGQGRARYASCSVSCT